MLLGKHDKWHAHYPYHLECYRVGHVLSLHDSCASVSFGTAPAGRQRAPPYGIVWRHVNPVEDLDILEELQAVGRLRALLDEKGSLQWSVDPRADSHLPNKSAIYELALMGNLSSPRDVSWSCTASRS